MKKGSVALVGAGCGDPEFLTQKALRILRGCEALVYDSLVSEQIVAEAPAACEKIYVGKRYGRHAMKQEEINALLIQKAREGKRVVRLKGGDPYVFGRGGEEFLALSEAGISCEAVPGITSAVAVPAAAGIPVTHRGKSRGFTVITGTTAQENGTEGLQMDFETLARLEGTLVILMGLHHLGEIADGLMRAGKDPATPCAVIAEGTTLRQRCVRAPLIEIAERTAEEKIDPPAVIVVGAVAQMELTGTTPDLPLSGVTVGVTGTPGFVRKLSEALRAQGAGICDMGYMEIWENPETLPDFSEYEWLVLTSPNGARIFLDKMKKEKRDIRSIGGNKIAVIGPGTAEVLEEAGIYADYMPDVYDALHLAEGLTERILKEASLEAADGSGVDAAKREKKPTLFLRAAKGSEALPGKFRENRLPFTEFALYEIGVNEENRERTLRWEPDYVVFGSSSGVRAFPEEKCGKRINRRSRYVCIGEACAKEARRLKIGNILIAPESSVQGIVNGILADVKKE
ncbi:MAG: uroporphyrinogen-III C-methyltransferase [Eubacteriales bacterium]|nr:uroporphyrinogen-III C-methyltransferase [Eubacteriales bacterium]